MRNRLNKKKPRYPNQLAASIVDEVTIEDEFQEDIYYGEDPHAVALERKGGKRGGPARTKKFSAKRRIGIAQKAARARWEANSS